jgi:hypothetical protein
LFEYGSIGKGVSGQPSYLEALLKENNMSKFVRFGNVIVNTDQIVCIMDNGGQREIMLHHLSLVTDETFGDLLENLNDNEPSNDCIPCDWIPCSERLPKNGEQVLVYLFGDSPYIAWYSTKDEKWRTNEFTLNADEEPKEWLPLPMPKRG